MAKIEEINYRLAALALFRELYNNNKNVYAILCVFIEYIVVKSNKTQFTATDIAGQLKSEFNFMIPEAVIDFVCKKHCSNISSVKKGVYECNINAQLRSNYDRTSDEISGLSEGAESIIDSICVFYKTQHPESDRSDEDIKSGISSSFYNFCLDSTHNNGYTDIISGFIVLNEQNKEVIDKISEIKEGVILYTGLRYTDANSTAGKWTNPITFYLDTELLFSAFGYNGEIGKKIFDEFFELVKEINTSSKIKNRDIIRLRYFEETKIEIDSFFEAAVEIVNGKQLPFPGNSAMPKIIEGCQFKSDVRDKYSAFFHYVNDTLKIEEEQTAYYQEQYNQFNIDEPGLTEYFIAKYPTIPADNIQKVLKLLNYINIKRKGINRTSFDDSKYVLITGKNFVMSMVADDEMKKYAPTYWATTIQFVTNRLWFRLNKGFGQGMMAPTAFNVVTSAQVLLAAQLKNKVTKSFAKFKEEAKEGKLTEDQIKTQYAGYRKDTIDADVINSSNVQDVLSDIISEDYYEKHLREEALLKQRLDESLALGVEKDVELQKAKNRILELEKNSKEQYDQQKRQLNKLLQKDIDSLVSQRKVIEAKIEKIDKKVNCGSTMLKVISYVLAGAFLMVVVFLCYKFGYNNVGSIITIILFVLTVINLILIKEGKKPKQNWIAKLVSRSRQRLFEKYGINEYSLSQIDSEIASLKEDFE